jgi:hypothetical protein
MAAIATAIGLAMSTLAAVVGVSLGGGGGWLFWTRAVVAPGNKVVVVTTEELVLAPVVLRRELAVVDKVVVVGEDGENDEVADAVVPTWARLVTTGG